MLLGLSGQPLQAEVQKALRAFVVLRVAVSRFLGFRGFGLGFASFTYLSLTQAVLVFDSRMTEATKDQKRGALQARGLL